MNNAIICVIVLALIQTFLGLAISGCRWKYRLSTGSPEDPNHILSKLRIAYSNCAEWHPIFYVLLLVQPWAGGSKGAIWLPTVVVSARCLFVMGILTFNIKKPNLFRFGGAALTYLSVILLSVTIIMNLR